jgi:uncharacterized membrane protein
MTHDEFMRSLDEARLLSAIRAAEGGTSGEIRICIARGAETDPLSAARGAFVRLAMNKTRDRNGVLLFIAPVSRTFAIVGDEGINRHCDEAFWATLAATMTDAFSAGRCTDGFEQVIFRIGEVLARYFPRDPEDSNELPDSMVSE